MDLVCPHIFGFDKHIRIGSLDPERILVHILLWYLALELILACSDKSGCLMDLEYMLYQDRMERDCTNSLALVLVFFLEGVSEVMLDLDKY